MMIKRKIQDELLISAQEYPAVTLLGPRQSGKTTLSKMAFPNHAYCSLEEPTVRYEAQKDPKSFLGQFKGGVIFDEIQRVPELLSYLQGIIDESPQKGRFILTGSHQPMVHQAVSQSLAGRTAMLKLFPFSIDEIKQYDREPDSTYEMIVKGFYPRLHDDNLRPGLFFDSYLSTYVERDVRAIINLKDLMQFEVFLKLVAGRIGQLVNHTSLANDIGVSSTTIKNWVSVLKASFILFELPPYYTNVRKRVVKSSKLYFVDVGLAAWLLDLRTASQVFRDPLRGVLYENLLVMEVVKRILNSGDRPNLHFYRDTRGNEVDLLISKAGQLTAVEIKSGKTFQPEFLAGINHFKDSSKAPKDIKGLIWYDGERETSFKDVDVRNPLIHGFDG